MTQLLALLIFSISYICAHALTIPYFAYGSNVYTNTMTAMRRIDFVDATAAILPGYKLRFNIPGMPVVEPSWACVEQGGSGESCVHGVLYELTPQDFAKVSMGEGVPFGYQWEKVDVFAYEGDGAAAGQESLAARENSAKQAYTLVSNNPFLPKRDIPPSKAYRDLIIKGARDFQIDQAYIEELEAVPIGFTIGEGYVAKDVLEAAERRLEAESKQ